MQNTAYDDARESASRQYLDQVDVAQAQVNATLAIADAINRLAQAMENLERTVQYKRIG